MNEKKTISWLVEYLLAIFLVLDGNSVYHALADVNLHLPIICAVLVVLTLFAYNHGKIRADAWVMQTFAGLFLWFGFYFVIKNRGLASEVYLTMFVIGVPMLLLYLYSSDLNGNIFELLYKIENVVVFLSIISTILWFLGTVLNVITPNCFVTIKWGIVKSVPGYFWLNFPMMMDKTFGFDLWRNNGLFTEAPMMNLWLCISLMTELFLKNKISKRRVLIVIICILTTISTTGVLFVALAIILKYYSHHMTGSSSRRTIALFVLIIALPFVVNILIDVLSIKSQTGSYRTRVNDYIIGFNMFKDSPIFGGGYGNITNFVTGGYALVGRSSATGFSNSFTAILGTGGLYNFLVYLIPVIGTIIKYFKSRPEISFFSVCYLYLSITTIFFARYIQAVFVAYMIYLFLARDFEFKLSENATIN